MNRNRSSLLILGILVLLLNGCQTQANPPKDHSYQVLTVESFLADMARNVAGNRVQIDTLIPNGVDPHTFEPSPQDIAKISQSDLLIINGAGFETWMERILENTGGSAHVIEASAGLISRTMQDSESLAHANDAEHPNGEIDPHFWLDPTKAIHYVENIRDGLSQLDPEGETIYQQNAVAYIEKLKQLDAQILEETQAIPPEKRQIVTNHESFGYYADRYGFKIVGTVIPSVSSGSAPSAQQLAQLVDAIRASHASVIFLETGANQQLAKQIAQETGVQIVSDLYTHSLSSADGPAPTYIAMMQYDTNIIVEALR